MRHDAPTDPTEVPSLESGHGGHSTGPGALGLQWIQRVERTAGARYKDRIARGRTWARGGRVQDLWFAPGLANARVVDYDTFDVTVRVNVFVETAWERAMDDLLGNLRAVGAIVEGEVTPELWARFEGMGMPLLPAAREIEGQCGCDDFAVPCAHVAALHHVLAEALDAEPLLLLGLRGRPREQTLASLRRRWGDREPPRVSDVDTGAPPAARDWFRSPAPLPPMSFSFRGSESAPLGLSELGPAPGRVDLDRSLRPLYEAGARVAREWAQRTVERSSPSRRRARPEPTLVERLPADSPPAAIEVSADVPSIAGPSTKDLGAPGLPESEERVMSTVKERPASQGGQFSTADLAFPVVSNLTERIIDHLASVQSAKSIEIARAIGVPMIDVRAELIALEKIGIVVRTGQTRGTQWWLG